VGQLGGHGGVQNLVAVAVLNHLESPTFLAGTRTQPKLLHFNNNSNMYKSKRVRWAGHVASMGERRGVYRVLVGKPEGKRPLKCLNRRIILRWTFRKWDMGAWTGLIWLRIGTVAGSVNVLLSHQIP